VESVLLDVLDVPDATYYVLLGMREARGGSALDIPDVDAL
jgi:hypothetical protein